MLDKRFTSILPICQSYISDQLVLTVNARRLHLVLGVGKDFSTWIKDRIIEYGFEENIDYTVFETSTSFLVREDREPNSGLPENTGSPCKDYFLSIDMAKELAMVENNDTGKQVRRYFIECKKQLRAAMPNFSNPAAVAEA